MGTIVVSGLGKSYKQYSSHWKKLLEWVLPTLGKQHQEHWVLRDINFEIKPGEAVGIVGANGAGKSTLLKLITGTTRATEGNIHIEGKVAALLELGMGFHPEFTGRQNVFMAGQLLGITVEELQELLPSIEAFAEIGEAIDRPIRTYSSGMQMRLAFSVATARRPDILIVDEALSVGDAYFQHKSFECIRNFARNGTTLLIVSHNRYALQSICNRAVLLDKGRIQLQGDPEQVLDYYNALMAEKQAATIRQETLANGAVQTISGTQEASIADVHLLDANESPIELVRVGQPVFIEVKVDINDSVDRLVLGFMIKDRLGQSMYGINTHRLTQAVEQPQQGEQIIYRFSFDMRLGPGNYSVAFSLSRFDSHLDKNYEWRDHGLIFHVVNTQHEDFVGCNWLNAKTEIKRSQITTPAQHGK